MPIEKREPSYKPRREARVLKLEELTEEQLRAGQRVTGFLRELAEAKFFPAKGSKAHSYLPIIEQERLNPTVLIDGRRGSGKSALLVTLLNLYNSAARGRNKILAELEGHGWDVREGYRIIPVGLVDLEPIPESTNLLLHLVGHLEQVVTALEGTNELPLASEPWKGENLLEKPSRRAWREFVRVTTLGWDGPDIRKSRLDPEAYALEAEHSERNRMKLSSSFRTFVDTLAEDYRRWRHWENDQHPLFLLAIDDADMNPRRSPELLSLVRKLHHPRLAFLMTGDSALFEATLRLDLARREGQSEGELPSAFHGIPREIYDKVIPPAQRCTLPPISSRKRLLLPHDQPIQESLESLSMPNGIKLLEYPIILSNKHSLADILPDRLRGLVSLKNDLNEILTETLDPLSRTARIIEKLWRLAVDSSGQDESERRLLHSLISIEETNVGSIACLHVDAQRLAHNLKYQTQVGSIGQMFPITLSYPTEFALASPPSPSRQPGLGAGPSELPEGLVRAYVLANDFARTSGDRGASNRPTITQHAAERAFTRIRWKQAAENTGGLAGAWTLLVFHWPLPAWTTHAEFFILAQAWQKILLSHPLPTHGHAAARTHSPDNYAWLLINLVINISRDYPTEAVRLGDEPDWMWLGSEIEKAATADFKRTPLGHWIQSSLGLFAAPESGLSALFSDGLISCIQEALGTSWEETTDTLRRERRNRLDRAILGAAPEYSRPIAPGELEQLLQKLSGATPGGDSNGHPFIALVHKGRASAPAVRHTEISSLRNALGRIQAPLGFQSLPLQMSRESNPVGLAQYVTNYRRELLADGSAWLTHKLVEAISLKNLSSREAIVRLWDTWTEKQGRDDLKNTVEKIATAVETDYLSLATEIRRVCSNHLYSLEGWKEIVGSEELSVFISESNPLKLPITGAPSSQAEALLRIAHDLAIDSKISHETESSGRPSALKGSAWWHLLKIRWGQNFFAAFPAFPFATLTEWEELEHIWTSTYRFASSLHSQRGEPALASVGTLATLLISNTIKCLERKTLSIVDPHNNLISWDSILEKLISSSFLNSQPDSRQTAIQEWLRCLPVIAAPETAISAISATSFLDSWTTAYGELDGAVLQRLRLERLMASGHSRTRAHQVLIEVDAAFGGQKHPWIERVGSFALEK